MRSTPSIARNALVLACAVVLVSSAPAAAERGPVIDTEAVRAQLD